MEAAASGAASGPWRSRSVSRSSTRVRAAPRCRRRSPGCACRPTGTGVSSGDARRHRLDEVGQLGPDGFRAARWRHRGACAHLRPRGRRCSTRLAGATGPGPLSRRSRTSSGWAGGTRCRRSRAQEACRTSRRASGRRAPRRRHPARSAVRRSDSSRANRQLRTWPSAVSRTRSQSPQNGRVTDAITPTVAGPPSTVNSSAGALPRGSSAGSRRELAGRARRRSPRRSPSCRGASRAGRPAASAR